MGRPKADGVVVEESRTITYGGKIGFSLWEIVGTGCATLNLAPAKTLKQAEELVASGEYEAFLCGGTLRVRRIGSAAEGEAPAGAKEEFPLPTSYAGWVEKTAFPLLWAYKKHGPTRLTTPVILAEPLGPMRKIVLRFRDGEEHEWHYTRNGGWCGRKKRR